LTIAPPEHRVEIGREDAPPFLFRHVDGAAGVGHPGIVDQDGDGAEFLLGGIESRRHRRAVAHVGLDGKRAATGFFNPRFEAREPVGAARHQHHRGAVLGQAFGKTHAEPAGGTGHQRDLAVQIEYLGHGRSRRPADDWPIARLRIAGINAVIKLGEVPRRQMRK
jgi:hypothetical protein